LQGVPYVVAVKKFLPFIAHLTLGGHCCGENFALYGERQEVPPPFLFRKKSNFGEKSAAPDEMSSADGL
jgi:hypothetical protein